MICYYDISLSSYKTGSAKVGSAWRRTGDKLIIQCLKNASETICFFFVSIVDDAHQKRTVIVSEISEVYAKLLEVTIQDPVVLGIIVGISFFSNSIPFSHSTCDRGCLPVERQSSPRSMHECRPFGHH
ncbi:hypothetical protein ARMGADRAFT_132468 [Armillaria gallica]|uniref:Uncharacterized protein n=1 Tax=Armillaria gallica TaxID=47427 RepID=A0A2H3DS56_ARMGA|nr:hypothetical protein ARMGADRAFT_132468 [Armillaria gallica]